MNYPKVSFLIPVLNEEKTLRFSLNSILDLDYPQEEIEIVLAVGGNTDGTYAVIDEYIMRYPEMKVIGNPSGNTAVGRNRCLQYASGELVMNYSGHVTAERNLLQVLVMKLQGQPRDVVGVGCSNINPESQGFIGEASGVAFQGFMGGKGLFTQNASYPDERFVDHMSFSLYRKDVVVEAGGFDERFWCGQDAELDIRLQKKGYRILYTPETRVYHYKRDTIRGLFRQMYRYGVARARMIRKHPESFRFYHLFGSGLVISVSLVLLFAWWFFPLLFVLYLLLSWVSSLLVSKKPWVVFCSPLFHLLIHFGYGLGFLRGLI